MKTRVLMVVGAMLAGCGADYTKPPPESSGGTPSPTTIELLSSGVSMKTLTVTAGTTVTFINRDTAEHQITSNPHPTHGECPELNGPSLAPGASFTATIGSGKTSCGFHDHLNPTDGRWQGSISVSGTVGNGGGGGGGGGGPYGY